MSGSAYRDLVFGVQALRRRMERDAVALGGATGAALRLLPHQVANVARVLSDIEVRHLLADEVGLGKTAQAIMVLNALRLQRPDLRAAIVVPDALALQWRDELRSRGHVAPVEGLDDEGDDRRPRLLWPHRLRGEDDLDLAAFDLLIVDEPQQLTDALQRKVASAGRQAQSVLILTATPPFRKPEEMRRLLGVIEPSRIGGDEDDPFAVLRGRERAAADALVSGAWTGLGGPPPADEPAMAAAAAHSAARRIVRTRRAQWARHLPRRQPRIHLVEPTAVEQERQRLMWSYFAHLGDLARDFELDLLAQRVLRGPASLRQRVTYLRGHGHERGALLARVSDLLGPQFGDSRFDALLDILCTIWAEQPEAPVLIAAGDNLTVDDLAKRLPRLFDDGPSGQLTVATLRNQSRGAESLADPDDVVANAMRDFQTGEVKVLIAAEVGSVGLNLQHARHIVLYSIPWDPNDVEQWIGRVDRIGNTALLDAGGGTLSPIEVHVPAQRGLVDERVVQVLTATGILERSISLDADAIHAARGAILQAALANDEASWSGARRAAAEVGATRELEDLGLPLLAQSPWTAERAAELGERIVAAAPVPPVLGGARQGEPGARESALYRWLKAMDAAGEYEVRKRRVPAVRSIGYPQRVVRARGIDDAARVPLDESVIRWPGVPFAYFRHSRDELEQPPLTHVELPDRDPEHLFFLDHGSPLHFALLDAWNRRLPRGGSCRLRVPPRHPLSDHPGVHLIAVGIAHPDRLLLPRPSDVPVHLWEADVRFVRTLLPARVLFAAARVSKGQVVPVDEQVALELLAPSFDSPLLSPRSADDWGANIPEELERLALDTLDHRMERSGEADWSHRLPAVRSAISRRAYMIRADLADWSAVAAVRRAGAGAKWRTSEIVASARIASLERAISDHGRAFRRCAHLWISLQCDT